MSRSAAVALLCALCIWGSVRLTSAAGGDSGAQGYSCDAINQVPREQQCTFVRESCSSESLVPYAEWYYCDVEKAHAILRYMYVGLVCCLLPLTFCLLGDTAEFYIAPIMAHVSQAIPKMRPRFAGVTFVALGNGAPDLSANIAAISSGEITLSAGALTGAAMFVQCIVAAELVALAGPSGIKCGGAMLRDVGVYCLAIFSVLLAFALGQVSRAFVGWAITLYILYMIWVFAGDEWHQRGRPRPQRLDIKFIKGMLSGVYQAGGLQGLGAAGSRQTGGPGPMASAGLYSTVGELEESLLPWAVAEEEDSVFHEPSDFEQPLHPPISRISGGSLLRGSATGSISFRRASTELTELSELASAGIAERGSTPTANPAVVTGSRPTQLLPQRTLTISPSAPLHQVTSGVISQQQSWRRGSATSQQPHLLNLGSQTYIDPKTYKQLVWADLADDQEEEVRLEREIAQQLLAGVRRQHTSSTPGSSYQPPDLQPALSQPVVDLHGQQQHQQQEQPPHVQAAASATAVGDTLESGLLLSPFGPGAIRTAPSTPAADATAAPAGASPAAETHLNHPLQQQQGGEDVWQQLQWQVTLGNSEEWADSGPVRQLFRKVTFPMLLPVYLGQRLTIPFASAAGYSREWLIAALLCCPLALVVYLGLLTLPAVFGACGFGIAAAIAAMVLTLWDEPGQMPVQGLGGTVAAVVPGVLAVLAFVMGIVWIDTIATEVVGVLTFVAGLAGLPSGVMGLTLLAWGSSLGDFFGNRAMAKAGHGSTAITACFAAPLFNMLMSLSLGFSSYLHKIGSNAVKVRLTPEVALGCIFLMGYNTAIICIGRLCGQRLPPWFAYFARAWYGLYFVLSVFSGFYSNSLLKSS